MRKLTLPLCAALVLALAAGCSTRSSIERTDDALAWTRVPKSAPTDGAIYRPGLGADLAGNPVARHVGDIVTVVLDESTAAQKSATTNTQKTTSDSLPGPTLLGKPVTYHGVPILDNSLNNAAKFTGKGDSAQSNSLTGYLAVTVIRVLPNGDLIVAGQKQLGLNQGKEYLRLTGVIRPIDLSADDTIPSYRVADAHISYIGRGALADANTQSWLSRLFNSPWLPF